MPFFQALGEAAILPLRAIVFQCLLLLVAIALEAIVLRKQLQLGFQPSIRYATSLNLLTVVLGWILFLGVEQLLPTTARTQIISYVLFGHFYTNPLITSLGPIIVGTGLVMFFLTFWVKATALRWLTWLLGDPIVKPVETENIPRYRYRKPEPEVENTAPHLLAVLRANALSFTAVLILLLLRNGIDLGL